MFRIRLEVCLNEAIRILDRNRHHAFAVGQRRRRHRPGHQRSAFIEARRNSKLRYQDINRSARHRQLGAVGTIEHVRKVGIERRHARNHRPCDRVGRHKSQRLIKTIGGRRSKNGRNGNEKAEDRRELAKLNRKKSNRHDKAPRPVLYVEPTLGY